MRGQEAYPHHAPRYPPVTARRWGSRPTSRRPLPGKGNQKLRPDPLLSKLAAHHPEPPSVISGFWTS